MILVDSREKSQIPKKLLDIGVKTQVVTLAVGDYQILGDSIQVVVESKSTSDYIGSIESGRLSNELTNMCENFDRSILAIHGNIVDALMHRNVKRSTYFHYLAGCVVRGSESTGGSVSVINFENDFDFVLFLKTVDSLVSSDNVYREPTAHRVKVPPGEEQLYGIVGMFPPTCHIGKKRAAILLDQFRSIKGITNATKEEIMKLDGFGETLATQIINHISKEKEHV
jgi:ERCC4-type nuclease